VSQSFNIVMGRVDACLDHRCIMESTLRFDCRFSTLLPVDTNTECNGTGTDHVAVIQGGMFDDLLANASLRTVSQVLEAHLLWCNKDISMNCWKSRINKYQVTVGRCPNQENGTGDTTEISLSAAAQNVKFYERQITF